MVLWLCSTSNSLNCTESLTIFGRRLTSEFQERAVEMGERLEPGLKGNLADTEIRIHEQLFHALNSHSRQVFGERDACALLEQGTEVKPAQVKFLRQASG